MPVAILQHSLHRPEGTVIITDPAESHEIHTDCLQCRHCQRIMMYRAGAGHKLHFCYNCNGYTCDAEKCLKECLYWEKALDLYEAGKIASL